MSYTHKAWITLDSNVKFKNKHFRVIEDKVLLSNQEIIYFTYISRLPGVMIVPVIDNCKVILVKQYRHILKKACWEFPAGAVQAEEAPLSAARRELEEETGYQAVDFKLINKFFTSNGTTDEVVYLYFATNLSSGTQRLDATESDMVLKVFEISDCLGMVTSGEITCAQTILALLYLNSYF